MSGFRTLAPETDVEYTLHGRGRKQGERKLKYRRCLLVVTGLALVSAVTVCSGMMLARQTLVRTVDAERETLLRQGWSVSWRTPGFSLFSLPWRMTLRDIRLSGPFKNSHLVYGGDAMTLSPAGPFSSAIRIDFTGSQALLLGRDSLHPDLAFRLTGTGVNVIASRFAKDGETHAAFRVKNSRLEVYAIPFAPRGISLPFSLGLSRVQGRTEWYLKQTQRADIAVDVTAAAISLPVAVPGSGNLVEALHVALSAGEMESGNGDLPTVTLHIGEARLGPSSFAVAGKLACQPDVVGDFNLTLRGLEKIADSMVVAGAAPPEVRRLTMLIERYKTQGNLEQPSEKTGYGDESMPDTVIDLPLRLRNGQWMIGALPVGSLLEIWRSGKDRSASP
ncbi:MAG: DUF2125 domain-containing protein [Acetobacter aceti]|nr:DUF2125 domain-containing protein [Acetobacter aceti]